MFDIVQRKPSKVKPYWFMPQEFEYDVTLDGGVVATFPYMYDAVEFVHFKERHTKGKK
jgi:hypothetical protein